jgi:hypothetical protein
MQEGRDVSEIGEAEIGQQTGYPAVHSIDPVRAHDQIVGRERLPTRCVSTSRALSVQLAFR